MIARIIKTAIKMRAISIERPAIPPRPKAKAITAKIKHPIAARNIGTPLKSSVDNTQIIPLFYLEK
jgi:hypothetical protein